MRCALVCCVCLAALAHLQAQAADPSDPANATPWLPFPIQEAMKLPSGNHIVVRGKTAEAPDEEDMTTWVRLHIDDEMSMRGRPLGCSFASFEGEFTAARVRALSAGIPGYSSVTPVEKTTSGALTTSTVDVTTTIQPTGVTPGPVASMALYGGTGTIGCRYDNGNEFLFSLRYLQGSGQDNSVYFYAPRLGWNFNSSFEEWLFTISLMGRGLFTGTSQNTAGATYLTTNQTETTTTTASGTYTGVYPYTIPPTYTTTTSSQTTGSTSAGPAHLTSRFIGGGGELGLGVERAFADTGLSAFAQVRPAYLLGSLRNTTTFLTVVPGASGRSSLTLSLLDVAGSLGLSYRPPFFPALEARVGYSFENFWILGHRSETGGGSLLTFNTVFAAVDLSF